MQWSIPLQGGTLQFLVFSMEEVKWIFSYIFVRRDEKGHKAVFVNELRLVVDYSNGVATGVNLCMHVVFPEKLGKEYMFGMDVSPGAKTHFEFSYAGDVASGFRLQEIVIGAFRRINLSAEGPVSQVRFPFPVPDVFAVEHGAFTLPFMSATEGMESVSYFCFPGWLAGRPQLIREAIVTSS